MYQELHEYAVDLLQELIAIPSYSREENKTADLLEAYLIGEGINVHRKLNNIWCFNKHVNPELPTILLNSHHDTVKPNTGYTRNPFDPTIEDGKLFGLGSNDAGGCLVALLATFQHFYSQRKLKYNLVFAATAEEEVSGKNGIELILSDIGEIDAAIVGEPTEMHLAVAEKGLLVLDCFAKGVSGHAAREEGVNAIYEALAAIDWFKNYSFPKVSEHLGPVNMSVTMIQAGTQHNVVPDSCNFTVDVRLTDMYTIQETLDIIKENVNCEVIPRSTRLKPSAIAMDHPLVMAGIALGRTTYGSPTTSDQALMPFPSVKLGPGYSGRSHMADEFIYLKDIEEGIELYIELLSKVIL